MDDPAPERPAADDAAPADARARRQALLLAPFLALGALAWSVGALVQQAFNDPDAPWHLACGRVLVERGDVPRVDPLCWTSGATDWINLNWLAQALLYRAYLVAGLAGPLLLAGLALCATLLLVERRLRAEGARPAPTLAALAACAVALSFAHAARPQAFSFTLFAACALLLRRDLAPWRAGALALALGLWGQLHGGVLYGFALLGLDLVGGAVDARLETGRWDPRRAGLLAAAGAAGVLSFALHPHGFGALVYAVTYRGQLGADQLARVDELMPLDLGHPTIGPFVELYLLAAVVALFASRSMAPRGARASCRELLPALFFLHLTLQHRRALIPFVVLTAPAVARWATLALDHAGGRAGDLLRQLDLRASVARTLAPWTIAAAAALLSVVTVMRARPGRPGALDDPAWDDLVLPVAAARHLAERPPARLWNQYEAGGVVAWALYPAARASIDGRGDLHARSGAFAEYLDVLRLAPGWELTLERHGVDAVLMPKDHPLVHELVVRHGWVRTHEDAAFAVVRRRG